MCACRGLPIVRRCSWPGAERAGLHDVLVVEMDAKVAVKAAEIHGGCWASFTNAMLKATVAYRTMCQLLSASALLRSPDYWAESTVAEGQLPWWQEPKSIKAETPHTWSSSGRSVRVKNAEEGGHKAAAGSAHLEHAQEGDRGQDLRRDLYKQSRRISQGERGHE